MKRGGARKIGDHFYARARFGDGERIERRVPWAKTLDEAAARGLVIGEVLTKLVAAGRRDLVKKTADLLAKAETPKRLDTVRKGVEAVVAAALKAGVSRDVTIREWGRRYVSGELAQDFPDHVSRKDHDDDESRLRLYIAPVVGDIAVVDFTLEHAELVMSKLPREKIRTPASRRHVAQLLARLLNLAVFPGRLLKASPLPRGWLPKIPKGRHYSCLWPREEAQLLACADVALVFRLYCGVLNREGMRVSELWDSAWWQWNLEVGTFTTTKTKTDDPRLWALNPGVVRAMKRWRAITNGTPDDKPFAALEKAIDRTHLAEEFRSALKIAGVDRRELFETTAHVGRLRAHDMRATFVTLSIAEGRPEAWVRDRTAHKTTTMIDRYRRLARQVAELELGALVDLEAALDASFRAVEAGPGESPGEDSETGGAGVGKSSVSTEGGTRTLTPNGRRILNRPPRSEEEPPAQILRGKRERRGAPGAASPGLPPPSTPGVRGSSVRDESVAAPEEVERTPAEVDAHASASPAGEGRLEHGRDASDGPTNDRPGIARARDHHALDELVVQVLLEEEPAPSSTGTGGRS